MPPIVRMRYFASLIFLVILCQNVPSLRESSHAATECEPLILYTNHENSWSWDTERDFEMLIRGQNRYTRYLRNYGLWANLYGYEGRLRPKSLIFDKLKNTDTGMQFGIDLPSGGMFTTGLYYSYSSPTLSVMSSPFPFLTNAELDSTHHLFGLCWTSYGDGLFMRFGLNGGFDNHDFHTPNNGTFTGSGWQLGGNSEFGLDIELEKWRLRPHLTFDYRWLRQSEMDNWQGVLFRSAACNALYSNLGVRAFRPLGPILNWQTRLSWLHNYLGSDDPIRVQRFGSVSGMTTPTQLYLDGNLGRDWLWFGTGLKLHFGSFFSFFVDYDLTFNKYETTHCGSVMLLLSW
ncbi:MAG: autotransporter outer membrane beta-barrel domain-containing protein [Planctomycetaceae bacterium]|nr:autotransporter outer membrane beta-barrel domain-containing protein [Planctomycetaceae bacterium]